MNRNIANWVYRIKRYVVKNKEKVIVVSLVILVIYGIWYFKTNKELQDVSAYYIGSSEKVEKTVDNLVVYIAGEVNNPGVYELKEGDRVNDLIKASGGITDQANLDSINLARKVTDGEKIYIPKEGEEVQEEKISVNNMSGKIDINTANITELQMLDGIGSATAKKIVEYREKNGRFSSIEDIKKVGGIGESKYNSIKEKICVK